MKSKLTYILFARGLYKIGKTNNIKTRLNILRTANPDIEILYLIQNDVEAILKKMFKNKRYKREWFRLEAEDLMLIEQEYFEKFL